MKYLIGLLSVLMVMPTFAGVRVSDGTVTISVSGGDANQWGGNGGSAGDVDIFLSYADAAKTLVNITGTTTQYGKTQTISEQVPLKDLKSIQIWATGGNGANGYSGSSGSSGWSGSSGSNGWDGSDGCPPSDGRDGSDGSDGTNGSDGGNGGNGGSGGRGGQVVISTSPEQNELLLFVKTSTGGGSGGAGGYGGSGGPGGRGGDGGRGGRGGRNNCKDKEGKPISGPDGRDGRDGNRGRDGRDGSNGYAGSDGYGGRSGSRTFKLVSPSGSQSYTALFDLDVTAVTFLDDNGNMILEPGERLYLTSLQVTNKGPMPSPAGQKINYTFAPSATLQTPAELTVALDPIGPGASGVTLIKKGALTLQVPDQDSLIGKKAVASGSLRINGVAINAPLDTGMAIGWPVSVSNATAKGGTSFEATKAFTFTLKNVGEKAVGPQSLPMNVAISWSSKAIPGSDVYVTLANGQKVSLEKPAYISNLTIPAKGTTPLSLNLLIRNRKLLNNGSGNLRVSLRLPERYSGSQNVVQTLDLPLYVDSDTKLLDWNQTVKLAGSRVQCQFPLLEGPTQEIAYIQVAKAAGSDKVDVRIGVPGSTESANSPVITISSSRILPYYMAFTENWTSVTVVDFLNKLVAPNTPRGPWSFKGCEVRAELAPTPVPAPQPVP